MYGILWDPGGRLRYNCHILISISNRKMMALLSATPDIAFECYSTESPESAWKGCMTAIMDIRRTERELVSEWFANTTWIAKDGLGSAKPQSTILDCTYDVKMVILHRLCHTRFSGPELTNWISRPRWVAEAFYSIISRFPISRPETLLAYYAYSFIYSWWFHHVAEARPTYPFGDSKVQLVHRPNSWIG